MSEVAGRTTTAKATTLVTTSRSVTAPLLDCSSGALTLPEVVVRIVLIVAIAVGPFFYWGA